MIFINFILYLFLKKCNSILLVILKSKLLFLNTYLKLYFFFKKKNLKFKIKYKVSGTLEFYYLFD